MELEIHVDRDRCIGSGQCVWIAPGVFDQDEQAISVVVDPHGEPEEKIVKAVTSCPVEAISLRVEGRTIGARDLWQWQLGLGAEDPVIESLTQLSHQHEELRATIEGVAGAEAADGRAALVASLNSHLAFEDAQVYPVLTGLLDPSLVTAFDSDHATMKDAASRLERSGAADAVNPEEVDELVKVVDNHIRIEEAVLFPLALSALRRAAKS